MSEISPPSKDPDQESIHFSEEFRRAKRNVLFWATASILLSLGTTGAANLEVNGVVEGLSIQPSLLILLVLVVLTFMLAGYVRTEARIRARHTQFGIEARLGGAADRVDALIEQLGQAEKEVMPICEEVKRTGEQTVQAKKMLQSVLDTLSNSYAFSSMDPEPFAQIDKRRDELMSLDGKKLHHAAINLVDQYEQEAKIVTGKYRAKVEGAVREAAKSARPPVDVVGLADRYEEKTIWAQGRFSKISDSLRGFGDSIGRGERRWFFFYDRMPVIAISTFAFVFAIWRFCDPSGLAVTVARII